MQHPDIYGVLLELADHCDVPDVRANAVQLLNCLPTHSQVLDSIRAALQGPQPAQDLENLLSPSHIAPTRLLYTLQVCTHKIVHTRIGRNSCEICILFCKQAEHIAQLLDFTSNLQIYFRLLTNPTCGSTLPALNGVVATL